METAGHLDTMTTVGRGTMCALIALAAVSSACAQDAGPDANGITSPSIATSLPYNGDYYGTRKRLAEHGVTYNLIYTNDILSNVSGGLMDVARNPAKRNLRTA